MPAVCQIPLMISRWGRVKYRFDNKLLFLDGAATIAKSEEFTGRLIKM